MLNEDFEDFSKIWGYLSEIYGKPLPSTTAIKLIFNALTPFTLEQVKNAAGLYLRTQKFMPRPADLAEMVFGTSEERARVAFVIVLKATESVRGYQSIAFDDKATQEVIYALGGWGEFCHELKKNRSLTESRFLKWYQAALTITNKKAPEVLVGIDASTKNYIEVGESHVAVRMLR